MTPATLLLAARQAYAVAADGSVGACPGSDRIGWTSAPRGIVSGCNAALIGNVPEGVIVAFQGTLPPSERSGLADWAEDLDADPVSDPHYPGLVHAGFRDAVAAILPRLAPEIPAGPLFITGHSLGGAMAQLAAFRLAGENPNVVTFAAPMVGDAEFAASLASLVRYENQGDVVPSVPPGIYKHAGTPRLIWGGSVVADYPNGWTAAVWRSLLTGGALAAHTIDAGGGYAEAVGA